jgi:carboxymethylenebutenolidase
MSSQANSFSEAASAEALTLAAVWDQHLRAEFNDQSPAAAMATMVAEPRNLSVPILVGGDGQEQVREFYQSHFLHQIPADLEILPVSRTVGQGRLVDEIILRFTHDIELDWVLPGVAPTGKHVEVGLVVVVQFDGEKMVSEHIYWDQASVLVQLGLVERGELPVMGGEAARAVVDCGIPLNELILRAQRSKAH